MFRLPHFKSPFSRCAAAIAASAALLSLAEPGAGGSHARAQTPVDLELVLAVDASASVDPFEYRLQMGGIAAAIRDEEVLEAIASGPLGRIGIAVTVWADATLRKQHGEWFVVEDAASAEAFAGFVERFYRRISGGTGLGSGIAEAIRLMEGNGLEGVRKVVDVSGDGVETPPRENVLLLPHARSMALARGVTVNGLAILTDVPDLADYYREEVLAGPGAFVMAAGTYEGFAEAFRRKLIREIEYRPPLSRLDREADTNGMNPASLN